MNEKQGVMTNRRSRTAEMTSGIVVVLLVAAIAVFAGSPSENAPNTLEDIYGDPRLESVRSSQ